MKAQNMKMGQTSPLKEDKTSLRVKDPAMGTTYHHPASGVTNRELEGQRVYHSSGQISTNPLNLWSISFHSFVSGPQFTNIHTLLSSICSRGNTLDSHPIKISTHISMIMGLVKTRMAALVEMEQIAEEMMHCTTGTDKHMGLIWR